MPPDCEDAKEVVEVNRTLLPAEEEKSNEVKGEELTDDDNMGVPTDKGWAWVISACVFLNFLLVFGHNRALSALFVDITEEFHTSNKVVALTFGALNITSSISAVVSTNFFLRRYTARQITVSATVLNAVCSIVASQSPSIAMWLCVYAVKGVSFGVLLSVPMSVIGHYFKKRKSLASTIGGLGSVVAFLAFPPLAVQMRSWFGLRGAMLLLGGVELHLCGSSMLLRPPETYRAIYKKERDAAAKKLGRKTHEPSLDTTRQGTELENSGQAETKCSPLNNSNGDINDVTGFETRANGTVWNDGEETPGHVIRDRLRHNPEAGTSRQIPFPDCDVPLSASAPAFRSLLGNYDVSLSSSSIAAPVNHKNKNNDDDDTNNDASSHKNNDNNNDARTGNSRWLRSVESLQEVKKERASSGTLNSGTPSTSGFLRVERRITSNLAGSLMSLMEVVGGASGAVVYGSGGVAVTRGDVVRGEKEGGGGGDGEEVKPGTGSGPKKRGCCALSRFIDTSLFELWIFRTTVGFVIFGSFTNFVMVYLPAAAHGTGVSKSDAALLLTIAGSVDLASRIVVGFVADLHWVSKELLVIVSLLISAVLTHCAPLYTTHSLFIMFAVLGGAFLGFRQNLLNSMLLDYVGAGRCGQALGVCCMFISFIMGTCHPVIGALADETGNFLAGFHLIGTMISLAIVFLLAAPVSKRWDQARCGQRVVRRGEGVVRGDTGDLEVVL